MNNSQQTARVGLFFLLGIALIWVTFETLSGGKVFQDEGYQLIAGFESLKELKEGDDDAERIEEFRKEFAILSAMDHPSLIMMYGCSSKPRLREELREELRGIQEASASLYVEQQDSLIRDVAVSHGIKSEDDIAQFTTDMRAAMENPFFRMGGFGGGGRRGGFGGHPGAEGRD